MSEYIQGKEFLRGKEGDARRGTVYGHRSSREYNRVVIAATEKEEGRKVVLMHYARRLKNDNKICEFVVVNGPRDPGMKVISRVSGTFRPITVTGDPAQGTCQLVGKELQEEWARIEQDDKYIFLAPPSYDGGPIAWFHDDKLLTESLVYESDKVFWDFGTEQVRSTETASVAGTDALTTGVEMEVVDAFTGATLDQTERETPAPASGGTDECNARAIRDSQAEAGGGAGSIEGYDDASGGEESPEQAASGAGSFSAGGD